MKISIQNCKDWANINVPSNFNFNLNALYFNNKIKEYQLIAKKHGGKIISENFINTRNKLKVKCKCGREWMAWPDNLKKGHWCASCSAKKFRNKK